MLHSLPQYKNEVITQNCNRPEFLRTGLIRLCQLLVLALVAGTQSLTAQEENRAEKAEYAVLEMIQKERQARLEYDAEALVALQADSFILVQNGAVSRPDKAERLLLFRRYFSAIRFISYELQAPPQITVSPDGRLAVAVVRMRVEQVPKDAPPSTAPFTSDHAWTAIYQQIDSQWKMTHMTTTRTASAREEQ